MLALDSTTDMTNSTFWRCTGKKDAPHLEEILTQHQCPRCGKLRPMLSKELSATPDKKIKFSYKPIKNFNLFIALIILNLISGFTTVYGAMQILPIIPAFLAGGTIQFLLFFLVYSKSTLSDRGLLKWSIISILIFLSVYTSFFSYYNVLTEKSSENTAYTRALSAHQRLVANVYTPIKNKINSYKSEIKQLELSIADEKNGKRSSAKGEGPIYKHLVNKRETLNKKLMEAQILSEHLKPFFDYDLANQSAEKIFQADMQALSQVNQRCLTLEPNFNCLTDEYISILDPTTTLHHDFINTYFDRDMRIGLLAPVLKIRQLEEAALGSAFLALMIDGAIILLGLGIEPKQKPRRLNLQINTSPKAFYSELLNLIDDSLLIDLSELESTHNKEEYANLLQNIQVDTYWLIKVDRGQWQIASNHAMQALVHWLVAEREKCGAQEHKVAVSKYAPQSKGLTQLEVLLPRFVT